MRASDLHVFLVQVVHADGNVEQECAPQRGGRRLPRAEELAQVAGVGEVHDEDELGLAEDCAVNLDGWMDGWMDGRTDGWMGGRMGGRRDGRTDGRTDGWMDGWVEGWMDRWMDGWVGGRKDGWVDRWVGGWMD